MLFMVFIVGVLLYQKHFSFGRRWLGGRVEGGRGWLERAEGVPAVKIQQSLVTQSTKTIPKCDSQRNKMYADNKIALIFLPCDKAAAKSLRRAYSSVERTNAYRKSALCIGYRTFLLR